ncbi:MAG: hypothetical protein RL030_1739 [Pseudomonadota bacterium]
MAKMGKFPWGKVLDYFSYDFDGTVMEVTKYYPWKEGSDGISVKTGDPDETQVEYHCEELHAAFDTLDALLICWITQKRLGLNQQALVTGVCKALGVYQSA